MNYITNSIINKKTNRIYTNPNLFFSSLKRILLIVNKHVPQRHQPRHKKKSHNKPQLLEQNNKIES